MTTEEQLILVAKTSKEIRSALTVLENAGFKITELEETYLTLRLRMETYVPANYPDSYRIRSAPLSISEHLTESRDLIPANLHSPTSNGRIYTLTSAQRSVLSKRYGMTPTKEVKLVELAVWPASPTCVRHIIIASTDHVPAHRKHLLSSAVIDDWVTFCHAVETVEQNEIANREKDRFESRITRLFDRADEAGITYSCKKGQVVFKLMAEYDSIPAGDDKPEKVRNALKHILSSLGEHDLANLVKEQTFFIDDETKGKKARISDESFASLLTQYL